MNSKDTLKKSKDFRSSRSATQGKDTTNNLSCCMEQDFSGQHKAMRSNEFPPCSCCSEHRGLMMRGGMQERRDGGKEERKAIKKEEVTVIEGGKKQKGQR